MTRLTTLLATALATTTSFWPAPASAAGSSVLDLIPSNFDDVVLHSSKPALVEFFAPWCGHCKNLAPVYEELAGTFAFAKDKVSIAKVDADAEKELGKRFGVQGFPTLKWFDGKSDTPEDYTGGRDLESLSEFISGKIGVKGRKKAAKPSDVVMLNDTSFAAEVGGKKDVFVAFTAPWCGHCKSLAPTWETLATDFSLEPSVLIAKVDAEAESSKATAQSQGVKSFPTIKFFPAGSTDAEDYTGGRKEADFITFLNGKAGTHRVPGGGLDATAGTIESLDEILNGFKSSGEEVYAQIKTAATDLSGTAAEYYAKVAGKVGAGGESGKGYVEKELGRLEGLIGKGGLAQTKLDDLVTRSNVLRKFRDAVVQTKEDAEEYVEKEL